MELFKFELQENKEPKDDTNINRVCIYVNDEQKDVISKMGSIFKKNGVDNLSDYVIKKIYEDIKSK